MKSETVVLVGAGMVGHRCAARLRELDPKRRLRIVLVGEEPRAPYDRVHLTQYYDERDAGSLSLAEAGYYTEHAIDLRLRQTVTGIDREARRVLLADESSESYDWLVLSTGSAPFMPRMPGIDLAGVFPYRTIEDLEAIADYAAGARSVAVLGGGLLGLEAARAMQALGLETHVVEIAPRLMPRQLDDAAGKLLLRSIEELQVQTHLGRATRRVLGQERCEGLLFEDESSLAVDMVVVSAGIRPRDELARSSGLTLGERGGIAVDDAMRTSDARIFAVGECALHRGIIYGLVAPGYDMADVAARHISGEREATFKGADQSAKLKLMGVDVAMFGDPFSTDKPTKEVVLHDLVKGIYKRLVVSDDAKRLLGGILVGDAAEYGTLCSLTRSQSELPVSPDELILGQRAGGLKLELDDSAQVCSCNNVSKGQLCSQVAAGLCSVAELKTATRAGTGCGGCLPLVTDILNAELKKAGKTISKNLCEHFIYSRQELFDLIAVRGYRTFSEIVDKLGRGHGCEICKPAVASILASLHNELILEHETLQDTNDRYLANIQRGGLYSVIPRIPGGEITADKLMKIAEVAKRYDLYVKITGGQRIDLLGARLNQLPEIWGELVAAGFESGHAYGKAVRTVKSCVGSTWCRYGVQDSVGFAIRVEERYRGIRAPHKLKSAVSGCVRECAEAQSKDFGIIATEKGWNLYVCGNGGAKPRHADLLASDIDADTCIRYIDRFLMYYIRTADRLTRTSVWVEKLEGGIEHVRDVVVNDSLGLGAELERAMQRLVDTYKCEWAAVVEDPERRARFTHFANSPDADPTVDLITERAQRRPKDWQKQPEPPAAIKRKLPVVTRSWVPLVDVNAVPADGGVAVKYGSVQLAVFNFASRGTWYATQNECPHMKDMVLARGIVGDQSGKPKVACPLHKKTFSLETGECLSGDNYQVATFPVQVNAGTVYVELPPADVLAARICQLNDCSDAEAAE
ncbi:MAG TPA: nitrite reductase large subunit NirB [Polyangiales bacterium]|nr:nitrite reductase large subunit NirB [Polyangiales bacterium]